MCYTSGMMNTRHVVFLSSSLIAAAPAAAFELAWPVACEIGKTCWIQQYPDNDTSKGTADYTCGSQSYDTHDGTDVRLRTTSDTADVVASAAGTIKDGRDGVPDRLVKTEGDRKAIANIECGNGVVVDHGNGWETQYCHMKRGSVAVRKGQRVEAGQKLGEVGYSGDAAFPHLHLSVRKDGKKMDPFSGELGRPCETEDTSLWSKDIQSSITYTDGVILDLGFADGPVELPELEQGAMPAFAPTPDMPALVAYAWTINLRQGDVLSVQLTGPGGEIARSEEPLERSKAQYMLFAGKRKPQGGWPAGEYRATVTVTNGRTERLSKSVAVTLK
jgi:hypothetical protein